MITQVTLMVGVVVVWMVRSVRGLNYTGETALLDAAPADARLRHATAVTIGELGVFDFRGDGRARVALELGAFSSEKESAQQHIAGAAGKVRRGYSGRENGGDGERVSRVLALGNNEINRPVRDTEAVELDHVYLIFARSRAVNNFVARLHGAGFGDGGGERGGEEPAKNGAQASNDDVAAAMLCSNIGGWLESEFIAPITALRRPKAAAKKEKDKDKDTREQGGVRAEAGDTVAATDTAAKQGGAQPKISFISASSPSAQADLLMPQPTRVTAAGAVVKRQAADAALVSTLSSMTMTAAVAGNGTAAAAGGGDAPLLGADAKANEVFLVEYEWEWLVPHGGEYAVVIANCAATAVQFKYNLIMANRWGDGQWTNVGAGWMPTQTAAYPAVCYTLWAAAAVLWAAMQMRHRMAGGKSRWMRQPLAALVVGFVPVLRFMGCVADLSRLGLLWQNSAASHSGSYELTMVVVCTSLVDALADGAQLLVLLALAKGWGVVRARLAGAEKRLVPGLVVFVGVASLYDGATRGGGVLAVAVLECVALAYAWASLGHTRRVHAVQTLRLVSSNESALSAWWQRQQQSQARSTQPAAQTLRVLGSRSWTSVEAGLALQSAPSSPSLSTQPPPAAAIALMWSAARKGWLLAQVQHVALPLQALDLVVLLVSNFAVPLHCAYVGVLLVQVCRWAAFMAVLGAMAAGGLDCPDVSLPALPAIITRRSIPLPPQHPLLPAEDNGGSNSAAAAASRSSRRPMPPPLGRLHLVRTRSSSPFAASASASGSSS
ncbi:hypothetical protein IWW48_002799 [Coemansia sp. RSA 1200]|nr:hypothetical protein IWW48_002799 [Coemansia sp. RSA 1200]